jgi:uncharacterized paraquat-inducible protein A
MDVFAMIFCPTQNVVIGQFIYTPEVFTAFYADMALYLHLSMILMFSVLNPDAQFLIFFIIPIKAWILATFYLIVMIYELIEYPFPYNLAYAVAFLNYFLFFGMDVLNVLPPAWRIKIQRKFRKQSSQRPKVIRFETAQAKPKTAPQTNYTHRCTICGRTDASNPELEFRYCSRCKGYYCYCEDHISNHSHIE